MYISGYLWAIFVLLRPEPVALQDLIDLQLSATDWLLSASDTASFMLMQIKRCSPSDAAAKMKGAFDSVPWTALKHSTGAAASLHCPCCLCHSQFDNRGLCLYSLKWKWFPHMLPHWMHLCVCLKRVSQPGDSGQVGHQPPQVFLFYPVVITPGRKRQDWSSSFVSPTCVDTNDHMIRVGWLKSLFHEWQK